MSFSLCKERMVALKFYCEDAESVLREVGSSEKGLSAEEAAGRLERDGRNELEAAKKPSLISQFFMESDVFCFSPLTCHPLYLFYIYYRSCLKIKSF